MDVKVEGGHKLAIAAKEARKIGDGKTIIKEMRSEIRSAVPPFRVAVRRNALTTLPSSGGLNVWTSKTRIRAAIKTGFRTASIKLVGAKSSRGKKHDIRSLDRGRLRAPLFGNRRFWHQQAVRPGFFSDASSEAVEAFRDATIKAIDKAVSKVWTK